MKGLMIKAALLTALFSSSAMAWDCSNPANWSLNVPGNECYHVGPNPNAPPATTAGNTNKNKNNNSNTLGQGQTQTQGQGQGQVANGTGLGVGVGTGGKSTSTSAATGGTSTAQGGTSNAAGGKGGKATSNAAGGAGGAGGSGGAGGTATSASDSHASTTLTAPSNATVDSHDSSSTYIAAPKLPVNTAIAGYQDTNAPCRFAEGLGIQTMPGAASAGFTFKDHDCMKFRLAEYFYARHQDVAGDRLMCSMDEVRKALGKDCLDVVGVVFNLPPPVAAAPVDAVSHKELAEFEAREVERDKRILTHSMSK